MLNNPNQASFRKTSFIPRDISIDEKLDGTILMKSNIPLKLRELSLSAYLRSQAAKSPNSIWISERREGVEGWFSITFGDALKKVNSLTQALLNFKLEEDKSLVILSENSIEHALMTYASYQASIPLVPLTPNYALQPNAKQKLKERLSVVNPGVYFAQDGARYAAAIRGLDQSIPIIVAKNPRAESKDKLFDDLITTMVEDDAEKAFAAIDTDAISRLMFTSGSSGMPKTVIQSQRNIITAVESNLTTFGQGKNKVTRLDWMPWSHVTGSAILAATLISGGTFYIDDGKPVEGLFDKTLANLYDVSPTNYFSMPVGYIMLADALERDSQLAKRFFTNMLTLGYGGARLPDKVASRLQALAIKYTGFKIPIVSGYGSTETGPGGALVYWTTDRVGLIGLPQPGYDLKLVPLDNERFEIRVRGKGVTCGYLGEPEKTAKMFDEEGYYSMGDAATFIDRKNPLQGLAFAGRMSDEFKLVTGTFVRTGELENILLAATSPLLKYIVFCGEGEEYVGILAWLNLDAAQDFTGQSQATLTKLNANEKIRSQLKIAISAYNEKNKASSRKIRRVRLMETLPTLDADEIADKGSIRAQIIRRKRVAQVEELYQENIPQGILSFD